MSAQFFGRSGKVLYGAFSIVGMAYQSQYVNRAIPDDRVARFHLGFIQVAVRFVCVFGVFILLVRLFRIFMRNVMRKSKEFTYISFRFIDEIYH